MSAEYSRDSRSAIGDGDLQPRPEFALCGSNLCQSGREFLEHAFRCAGLEWEPHVEIDPRYYRPSEVDVLLGDASKARYRSQDSLPDHRVLAHHRPFALV